MLGAMMGMGGTATRWPSIPDDYERLKQTILAAVAASDIVVVNAGSSAGSEDYTCQSSGRPRAARGPRCRRAARAPCGASWAISPWSAFRDILSQRH